MEWGRVMKEQSQETKIKAAPLIDHEEQALRAAEAEIRRFEKEDSVAARSPEEESISWQAVRCIWYPTCYKANTD